MTAYMEMHGLLKVRAGWGQSDKATKSMDGRIKSRKTVIVRELPRIPRLEELAGLAPSFCFSQQLVDNLMKGAPLLLVVLALAAQPASCILAGTLAHSSHMPAYSTTQARHCRGVKARGRDRRSSSTTGSGTTTSRTRLPGGRSPCSSYACQRCQGGSATASAKSQGPCACACSSKCIG